MLVAFWFILILDERVPGGIHPRCDRKSAERVDSKEVMGRPLSKRVRKDMKMKGIDKKDVCGSEV